MNATEKEIELGTKEIAKKVKLPKKFKEMLYTKLAIEFGSAILVFTYFIFLNLGYMYLASNIFEISLKICSGILVIGSIIAFEIAYRKDNSSVAVRGIEILALGILTLFLPYIYLYRGLLFKFVYSLSSLYIAVYYVIKSLIICKMYVMNYSSGLSDVKDIILEEEVDYLNEINKRKFEETRELDESEGKISKKEKMSKISLNSFRKFNKKKNNVQNENDTNDNIEISKEVKAVVKEENKNDSEVTEKSKKVKKTSSKNIEKVNEDVKKKEKTKENLDIGSNCESESEIVEDKEVQKNPPKKATKKRNPKKRKKNAVKSLATMRKNNKEDGDK